MNITRPFELQCPYCGSRLEKDAVLEAPADGTWHGVLRCDCYRYAVLDGIPILRQMSPVGSSRDPVVEFLLAGNVDAALDLASGTSRSNRSGLATLLQRAAQRARKFKRSRARVTPTHLSFRDALQTKASGYGDYLYYRHANNSFMAATVLMCLLRTGFSAVSSAAGSKRPRRLLDLACGIGHASYLANALFPNLRVTAVDGDFENLRLARRYVCPDATLICLDAELPLPFADRQFDACVGLDGLHYIRSKKALLAELDRVLDPDGLWLFPHLHNALQDNVAAGVPLSPSGWDKLLEVIPHRIVSEAALLRDFADNGVCDLSKSHSLKELAPCEALAAVGTRRTDCWAVHSELPALIAEVGVALGWNPLWDRASTHDGVRLTPNWPTAELYDECAAAREILPSMVDVKAFPGMETLTVHQADPEILRKWIQRFVVVALPPGYREYVCNG